MIFLKDYIKSIGKYLSTYICLVLLFNVLMYLSCSFSSDLIENNAKDSLEIIKKEGNYVSKGFLAVVENVVDVHSINQYVSVDSKDPINSYLLGRKNYKKGQTIVVLPDQSGNLVSYAQNRFDENGNPVSDKYDYKDENIIVVSDYNTVEEFENFLNGKVTIAQTYSRYYHGHFTLFRQLLLFFNITGARILMTLALLCLLGYSVYLLNKKINFRFAFVFCVLIIVYGFYGTAQSLQESPLLLVTLISIVILLLNIEKYDKEKFMYHIFVTGCFACFYDYFTVPVLSLALPLIIFYAYNIKSNNANVELENFWKVLFDLIKIGIVWTTGFGCTWFSKFIIMEIVYRQNYILNIINQIIFRTSGETSNFDFYFKAAIIYFLKITAIVIGVFSLLVVFVDKVKFYKATKRDWKKNVPLLLIGSIPIAWMLIVFKHTIFHFTLYSYRNLMIIMMALLYTIICDKQKESVKE